MSRLLFRCSVTAPPVAIIAQFRRLTGYSIGELRDRIANQHAVFEITAFCNDWQEVRHLLVTLSRNIDDGGLPLTVVELLDGVESAVSPEQLRNLIQHYREIELETQRQTQLELGEIETTADFEPLDEDWTV